MEKEELLMHKDTYFFGYGIDIENPGKIARQVIELKEENQELKKQLHEASLQIQSLIEEDMGCPSNCSKLRKLRNQQKEFIEWLKQNIENEEYCYLSQNPSERCRKDVFEEALSKYKEIIGGSNDQ